MPTPAPKLLGTYEAPLFAYGQTVRCAVRGAVVVVGLSAAPIPWPVGRPDRARPRNCLVVYGGLAAALRRESTLAVAHWWGVGENTVWRWRKALGLTGVVTEGSKLLLRQTAASPGSKAALARAQAKSRDPEQDRTRHARISAGK